jgi:hypothetical protein
MLLPDSDIMIKIERMSALSANDFPNWAFNIPEPKAKTDEISRSTSATTSIVRSAFKFLMYKVSRNALKVSSTNME